MSPRWLGAAAIIVRSFARIHESNLKKQGVLPFTFNDPADYDRVLETDRVSFSNLAALGPGKLVGDAPPCRRHDRDARAPPHAERGADRLVPGGVGPQQVGGVREGLIRPP
jgi:hypothetical protein